VPELDKIDSVTTLKSPKSRLQERTQQTIGERPQYRVIEASGPDHEKTFSIEVAVSGRALGWGVGPSRRIAETAAAAQALQTLLDEEAT
jgi:ribonuclease-3